MLFDVNIWSEKQFDVQKWNPDIGFIFEAVKHLLFELMLTAIRFEFEEVLFKNWITGITSLFPTFSNKEIFVT